MDWLLNWIRNPVEFEMHGWNTNDQIPRGINAPYTYSDTPPQWGAVGNRMPNWQMSGTSPWGTASFSQKPLWYDEKPLLNQLLSYKPGTFQQRMDVERMLLDNDLQQWLMSNALRRGAKRM